ncbi:LuxR C-terminal-related transcriptional regulator [Geotalea uraniireducens]|nr:LuxR C-terminal-related transcriptional regulator [Geotalea uraniireducens]
MSETTVKFHVSSIMKKLNAVSRTHAVSIAISLGIIDLLE